MTWAVCITGTDLRIYIDKLNILNYVNEHQDDLAWPTASLFRYGLT